MRCVNSMVHCAPFESISSNSSINEGSFMRGHLLMRVINKGSLERIVFPLRLREFYRHPFVLKTHLKKLMAGKLPKMYLNYISVRKPFHVIIPSLLSRPLRTIPVPKVLEIVEKKGNTTQVTDRNIVRNRISVLIIMVCTFYRLYAMVACDSSYVRAAKYFHAKHELKMIKMSEVSAFIIRGHTPLNVYITPQKQTINSGQNAKFSCFVSGFPVEKISWLKDGKVIEEIADPRRKIINGTVLVVELLQRSDEGMYQCFVSSDQEIQQAASLLLLGGLQIMQLNLRARRMAEATQMKKEEMNEWKMSNDTLSDRAYIALTQEKVFKKMLTNFDLQHFIGPIHDTWPVTTLSSVVVRLPSSRYDLWSQMSPLVFTADLVQPSDRPYVSPLITKHFGNQVLKPRESLSLSCTVSGRPRPKLLWYVDNELLRDGTLYEGMEQYVSPETTISYFNISQVRIEDSGNYRCQAENKAGSSFHTARINVYGKLNVRPLKNVTVVASRNMILHCYVTGYPIESIQWQTARLILFGVCFITPVINLTAGVIMESNYFLFDSYNVDQKTGDEFETITKSETEPRRGVMVATLLSESGSTPNSLLRNNKTITRRIFEETTSSGNYNSKEISCEHNQYVKEWYLGNIQNDKLIVCYVSHEKEQFKVNVINILRDLPCTALFAGNYLVRWVEITSDQELQRENELSRPSTGTIIKESERVKLYRNGTLLMRNIIKNQHEGRYTCVVRGRNGDISTGEVYVKVVDLKEKDLRRRFLLGCQHITELDIDDTILRSRAQKLIILSFFFFLNVRNGTEFDQVCGWKWKKSFNCAAVANFPYF
ncbi:Down syndrome cell adhesion molecule [Nymphon striatum]|nr:Down syndrome cell adhesion molecule [Nymphon striatum]